MLKVERQFPKDPWLKEIVFQRRFEREARVKG